MDLNINITINQFAITTDSNEVLLSSVVPARINTRHRAHPRSLSVWWLSLAFSTTMQSGSKDAALHNSQRQTSIQQKQCIATEESFSARRVSRHRQSEQQAKQEQLQAQQDREQRRNPVVSCQTHA